MREYYNERLVDIFRRYSDVIVGQFYGHTHRDSIMILSDKNGNVKVLLAFPQLKMLKQHSGSPVN